MPDGAKYIDVHPENADPRNPTTAKPAEFLRPYLGYQEITLRNHFGTATNNSMQVQLNRRYINGLQFALAYTLAKRQQRHRSSVRCRRRLRLVRGAPTARTQLHNLA